MRRYETIFILRPSQTEKQIDDLVEMCSGIITGADGKIIDLDRWGMKKLAYPIKKEIQGFYVYIDYSSAPEAVTEMERRFRIDDAVLRYMTVKTAEEISDEAIVEAIELASNKKIAAAEAAAQENEEEASQTDDNGTEQEEAPKAEETTEE